MGNMSVNKLGGMCLIIGPVMALIFYLLQPGMIIAQANPADYKASMEAIQNQALLASLCALVIPLGLIMWLYGIRTLSDSGETGAWGRFGVQFIFISVIGWVVSVALWHSIAGAADAGADATAAYTVSAAVNNMANVIAPVGVLLLSLSLSSREGINKILSYIVAITALASAAIGIMTLLDPTMAEMSANIGGVSYVIWTIWFILGGLTLIKQ